VEPSPGRRRAATTSSRLFTQPRKADLGEWAGLSPRPASAHGRGSRALSVSGDDDPSTIGRAITMDAGVVDQGRRRSRSLSGLHDLENGRQMSRRRSDEIRYWRESYNPGFMSPLSSGHDGDNHDLDDTGGVSLSVPDSPLVDRPPKTPPQPFNFGSLASMNEMAGMKITQAAGMETRIGTMEARMYQLERIINQLCHSVPGFKSPLVELPSEASVPRSVPAGFGDQPFAFTSAAPPMIPAIYQAINADLKGAAGSSSRYSSSRHSVDTDSHLSFGEGQTYIGSSLHPPSSSATQAQSIPAPVSISPGLRPTSTSTVRGATSLPALGASARDEQEELLAQLEAERAARQALEAQVRKLSERVNSLSTTMFAMLRDPAAKKAKSSERLNAIPGLLKKKSTDSDMGGRRTPRTIPTAAEALGGAETPSEAFLTPREEGEPTYGAFGEELHEEEEEEEEIGGLDDPKRKKAARTLSLSQLTLKKGMPVQI
jgi:hypothetical protein